MIHSKGYSGTSTKVGRYKGRTVHTSDLQTSDWYNVWLVQTSDCEKMGTFISKNVELWLN